LFAAKSGVFRSCFAEIPGSALTDRQKKKKKKSFSLVGIVRY